MEKFLAKFLGVLLVTLLCFIPTWIWLGAYYMIQPDSDLAKIALFGIGLYFFGFIQLILVVVWIFLSAGILSE
jgi:hypothetical protein